MKDLGPDSRVIVLLKCILDCIYWYNKNIDNSFDFKFGGGYANIKDEDIKGLAVDIYKVARKAPIVVAVKDEVVSDILQSGEYEAFNHHNNIVTYHGSTGIGYDYISVPDSLNTYELFVAISTVEYGKIKRLSDGDILYNHSFVVIMENGYITVTPYSSEAGPKRVWVNDEIPLYAPPSKFELFFDVQEYLESKLESGSAISKVMGIKDLVASNESEPQCKLSQTSDNHITASRVSASSNTQIVTDSTGSMLSGRSTPIVHKYNNIYNILLGYKSVQERYDLLIGVMNALDQKIASKINLMLEENPTDEQLKERDGYIAEAAGSAVEKAASGVFDAARIMGGMQ